MILRLHGEPRDHQDIVSTATLDGFQTLEQVTQWAFALPCSPSLDVIAQDEFTLDVIIGVRDDLWMVFDTT